MEDRTLILTTEQGEIVSDILFTYFDEERNKNYVVFQIRDTGEVSAAVYVETDGKSGRLDKIETDEEWAMLEELLEQYSEELEQGCQGSCSGCSGCGNEDCDGNCDCK